MARYLKNFAIGFFVVALIGFFACFWGWLSLKFAVFVGGRELIGMFVFLFSLAAPIGGIIAAANTRRED